MHVAMQMDLVRLGSDYGAWTIPANFLDQNSVCYLAGAGEDISFDLALAKRYNCEIHILDPTPRALKHFNKSFSSNEGAAGRISFHPIALWGEDAEIRLYAPENPEHVSHSALNLQGTTEYIEVEALSVSSLMRELGHKKIDFLKLDIEGAEYAVLDSLSRTGVYPDIICVEFDEMGQPLNWSYAARINRRISALKDSGYFLINVDDALNCSFIHHSALISLK